MEPAPAALASAITLLIDAYLVKTDICKQPVRHNVKLLSNANLKRQSHSDTVDTQTLRIAHQRIHSHVVTATYTTRACIERVGDLQFWYSYQELA